MKEKSCRKVHLYKNAVPDCVESEQYRKALIQNRQIECEGEQKMKFCKNCGKEIDDAAVVCPNCGVQQEQLKADQDSGSIGWGILGCCIPLVGLILFLVWKDQKPKTAKAAGIGALVCVIAYVVLYILMAVLGVGIGLLGV